ncbi:MAG: TRAP transporter small permease [Peptococcaceae bacterium]|nr:TRAP transporter small permease [Peptococcaceae bacterium]
MSNAKFGALGNIVSLIEKICTTASVISVVVMAVFITLDVTFRKLFDKPITGCFEITEDYLMVALVFLSLSYVYKQGGHVRVTLFLRFLPSSWMRPLNVLLGMMSLGFFGLVAVMGWKTTLRAIEFKEFSSSVLAYPLAPAYFMVALGAALLCLRIIEGIIWPSRIKWEDH